ncbi:MAG TPA: hypothetical protein VIJ28_08960 [Chloroflexota bacterium]
MTHPDIVEEADRLVRLAQEAAIPLRLLGGIAVFLRCGAVMRRTELAREFKDIDLAAPRRSARALSDLLTSAGYTPNRQFNALQGGSRLLFHDGPRQRQIDVFLGQFAMCHALDLEPRITLPGPALPPSDLLLLKLQIIQLNRKDITDALALLLYHEPQGPDSADALSLDYLVKICAGDWGWYTTLHDNLTAIAAEVDRILPPADASRVQRRVGVLLEGIEAAPKSLGWRLRDRVGRRKAWYNLPEEVRR